MFTNTKTELTTSTLKISHIYVYVYVYNYVNRNTNVYHKMYIFYKLKPTYVSIQLLARLKTTVLCDLMLFV